MSDPVGNLKRELLAAAERRTAHVSTHASRGRSRTHPLRNRVVLVAAALSVAFAVTLVVSAQWGSSPGFLERARAALAPRTESILHQKLQTTVTSRDFGCTTTTRPSEIWIDQTVPHRWRVRTDEFLDDGPAADPQAFACIENRSVTELGGISGVAGALELVLPNTLTFSKRPYVTPPSDTSYVTTLREAIAAGIAHDEGTRELDGRTVERIRIDPQCLDAPPCTGAPSYVYVDPETFYPVKEVWPLKYVIVNRDGVFRFDVVVRYLTFEYLPRTPESIALTDIRAQHPGAKGP